MDKSLFISMGGAKNAMHQLEVVTNNLANVNTTAFRADSSYADQYEVATKGAQTRTYGKLNHTFTNFKQGSIINTERDLDVALNGPGFIAVQSRSGAEGYTRGGSFQLGADGTLMTQSGQLIMGNGGVISIPPSKRIHIGPDGTVSAQLLGTSDLITIDKIKLVNPETNQLQKSDDGLFHLPNSGTASADDSVKVVTGALEGSNVNAIETMTQLIDLTRGYQIHTNFMKTISDNAEKANELLAVR